jgi:hypothetical protein
MSGKSHLNRRVPSLAIAAVAVACSALVGCGGGSDVNRQASATSGYVVDGKTGNAADNKSYRGVELTIENAFKAKIAVSLAGYCRKQITGTNGFVTLENGEKARWRACNKIIYGEGRDYSTGESSAIGGWPGPSRERFTVLNPAATTPKFFFAVDGCFNSGGNDFIGGMKQNQTVRVENKEENCGAAVVVTRQGDSRDYIRFYAVVEPQS